MYIYKYIYIFTYKHRIYAHMYMSVYINIRGSLNKFPDCSRMGTFIDRAHMNL